MSVVERIFGKQRRRVHNSPQFAARRDAARRAAGSFQSGFSLIEVLVTVVVFSLGMLTVAGLQAVSKRSIFEGMQRTTASFTAYGLLEDLRANSSALDNYRTSADLGGGTITTEPSPACEAAGDNCSAAQLASHDLWHWEMVIDGGLEAGAGGLVSPTVCITGPAAGGAGIYAVTIAWRGTIALSDPALSNCGAASGNYGTGNVFRRMIQVTTFISPNV